MPAVRVRARLSLAGLGQVDLTSVSAGLLGSLVKGRQAFDLDVLVSEDAQKVTVLEGSAPSYTVVHRGPKGAAFWDHELRAFAEFSAADMPWTKVEPTEVQLGKKDTREEVRADLRVEDPVLGSLRHEFTFSRRKDLARFGPAFFGVLHCGPRCHQESGLPYAELSTLGFMVSERTFLEGSEQPLTELEIDVAGMTRVDPSAFRAPSGYRPLAEVSRPKTREEPRAASDDPSQPSAEATRQALERLSGESTTRALRVEEKLTPDCLGSTRFGSIAATIHQDLFDHMSSVLNMTVPFLGKTTIANGVWTIPWLANLASIAPTSPGSGIFCFLRDPRVPSTVAGGPSGGLGFLDRVAWQDLSNVDGSGMTRTQRDFAAGKLNTTLTSWGIPVPGLVASELSNTSGDMSPLPLDHQIAMVEGYETQELGVFRVSGLPVKMGPLGFGSVVVAGFTTPSLMDVWVTGISGTVDFSGLGGGPFVPTATIGSSGNVVVALRLPNIRLDATVARLLTPFGGTVLSLGTIGLCAVMPFLCPVAVVLVTTAAFIMSNVTLVTALCSGVTLTLNIAWSFDAGTARLEPFVTAVGTTGTAAILTQWVTPNVIANMFDGFVTTLGDLFNSWLSPIAGQAAKGVQDALRSAGFELPVSGTQTGLTAVGGSAMSQPGSLLQLAADVQPVQNVAVQPYVSQVATSSEITTELTNLHVAMRTALNPQPTPPTTPATVTVGTYVGLGLSQNVLNYYVYVQWLQKRFEVVNGDPALIAKLLQVAPPGLFQRVPKQVHLWPASPPRVETTPSGIASGVRPLVVFFDDVRACFELPFLSTGGDNTNVIGGWELSFNLKTTGTITFSWPLVFDVVLDGKATSFAPSDERSWEFADTNVLNVMGQVAPGALEPMVDVLAGLFLSAVSAAPVTAPPAARPWPRPLIAMQQEILKSVPPSALVGAQTFYMEILHRRKALYVLTAADTALMELVDGSGAPTLNAVLVGLAVLAMGSTVTVRTMTCAQGKALAKFLLPLLGLKAGPP